MAMKYAKQVLWLAGLTIFIGLGQATMYCHQAYVTNFTIRALQLADSDLERFQEARRKQIDLAVAGLVVAAFQVGVIAAAYRSLQRLDRNDQSPD
jgi:hypothetical protein